MSYDSPNQETALAVVKQLASIFTRELTQTLGVDGTGALQEASFDLIVRVFDRPHVEPEPLPEGRTFTLAFVGALGLALGVVLAIIRDSLDARVRTPKDAESWFGAPVLGTLPKGMRGKPPPGIGLNGRSDRHSADRLASLDLLRAKLEFTQRVGRAGRTLVVTSAATDDGKSTVAASLASTLARSGEKVICVDADVRRPSLHRLLEFPFESPGFADIVTSDAKLEDLLISVDIETNGNGDTPSHSDGRLEVLPAGSWSEPVRPLSPHSATELVRLLQRRADYVVFDAPPLYVADAFPLAVSSDSVLVVARRGRTTMDQAESVRVTLQGLGVKQVGIVLTDAPAVEKYA